MKLKLWAFVIILVVAAAGGAYLYAMDRHWRPKTITRRQAEIARLLERSGWVSPGHGGPKLYVIEHRACEDCARLREREFARLERAGVDTRVIMVALRDKNGAARSTPAERATVAELWANRSWKLLQDWLAVPPAAWTAPGIKSADDDAARSAVVEQSRTFVEQLQPLLKDNGFDRSGFDYPTLIWWDKDGRMRGCACLKKPSYRFVVKELGAS